MAGLESTATESITCCSPAAQETCCEPEAKAECCGDGHGSSCGCAAGEAGAEESGTPGESEPGELGETDVRAAVRERYAAAATVAESGGSACCGEAATINDQQLGGFGSSLYAAEDRGSLPDPARLASLGCGNPLNLARRNQRRAGVTNAEFIRGTIEAVPLPDASVDVIVSNCVINLSPDKPAVFREAARVLRPGGRFAVSDVVADPDMDDATRRDLRQWTGCIAGALTCDDFERELVAAGFESVEIHETHRVHEHASSAVVRAWMPPLRSGA